MKRPPATYTNNGYWKTDTASRMISPYAFICMPEAERQAALVAIRCHADGEGMSGGSGGPRYLSKKESSEIIAQVVEAVCAKYGVTREELMRRSRKAAVVWPRQVACAFILSRGVTSVDTARHFGMNHTTVLHARKAVAERCRADVEVARAVAELGAGM